MLHDVGKLAVDPHILDWPGPLTARIVTVVDAFDAMTSERAYREPLPQREALRRLRAGAGLQFDPRVVTAILRVL